MADTGISHFYLQLHDSVEGDPRLTSLSPAVYGLFVRLRQMALKGQSPGEINLSWTETLRCLGVRSEKRQAYLTQLLITDRRLLSRSQVDGAEVVVIARWTMPQLTPRPLRDSQRDPAAPRPKYPSDSPEARRRERAQEREAETTDTNGLPERPLAQQFFDAPDRTAESAAESAAESPQTPPKQSGVPNRIEEKSKQSKADSATPQTHFSAEEIAAAALLMSEGIDAQTSERLVREGANEALIADAVMAVNGRKVEKNRAGMLRKAVEAALSGSPYLPPNRHKANSTPRRIYPRPPLRPPKSGVAPPMALLRSALTPPGASSPAPAS